MCQKALAHDRLRICVSSCHLEKDPEKTVGSTGGIFLAEMLLGVGDTLFSRHRLWWLLHAPGHAACPLSPCSAGLHQPLIVPRGLSTWMERTLFNCRQSKRGAITAGGENKRFQVASWGKKQICHFGMCGSLMSS